MTIKPRIWLAQKLTRFSRKLLGKTLCVMVLLRGARDEERTAQVDTKDSELRMVIIGPFRVLDPDGHDLTPRGRKAQGLLAILAFSPEKKRPRRWLESKLWSGRGPEQAGASLRQTLAEIRKSLGQYESILVTDRNDVALSLDGLSIDIDSLQPGEVPDRELLEGLQIRDREFDVWLRSTRIEFGQITPDTVGSSSEGLILNIISSGENGDDAEVFADIFANEVGQAISERVNSWRRSQGSAPGEQPADIEVSCRIVGDGDHHGVFVKIIHVVTGRILFSRVFNVDIPLFTYSRKPDIATIVYPAADQAISRFAEVFPKNRPEVAATLLAERAVNKIFSFEPDAIPEAHRLLDQSLSTDPNGLYFAWKALATVFEFVERSREERELIREEVNSYARLAVEMSRDNPLVLSLAALARMVGFADLENSQHLIEQAKALNPMSPFTQLSICLGHMLSQNFQEGYEASRRASMGVMHAKNRHWWDTFHCIASIANGHYNEAIRAGERAVAVAPSFRAAHRHLLPLYASNGSVSKARSTVDALILLEPDFTLERFRNDPEYPVRTLRNTPLMDFPLEMF